MADPTATAAAAEQGSGGLPQFDLSQWPGQMVWMLIVFGVLVFLFAKVFTPKIGGTIAAREDKIGGDIGEARRLRDEAAAQNKAAGEEMAQARARAQRMALEAKAAAGAEAAARQAEAEEKIAKTLGEAETRIAAAQAEAMGQVRVIAAEACEAIVARLTGKAATSAEVEAALGRQ